MANAMIGKTIKEIVDLDYLDYHGQALIFTDGTAVELQPNSYGVQFEDCTELDVWHEQALQENRRRDMAVRDADAARRYAAGEMYGLELTVYEMVLESFKSMQIAMNRQVFGSSAGKARRT